MATLQRIRRHDVLARGGHWIHLVNMILLFLSGLQIHFATLNIFGSMNNARFVHFVDMYVFFFIGVFHVYRFFATGKWLTSGPTPRNLRSIGPSIRYYLFLSDHKPQAGTYSGLQIVTYLLLFAVSVVMAVIGFGLYWPVRLSWVVSVFGGLMTLRQVHYVLGWVFMAFTGVHLYLVLTQPLKYTRAMVTGSYWRRAQDGTTHRYPDPRRRVSP